MEKKKLPTHLARKIATESGDADPRTVQKVYAGLPVRGAVADRISAALRAAGLLALILCAQACEREGVAMLATADAATDATTPSRGATDADVLATDATADTWSADEAVADALPAVTPDAVASGPEAMPDLAPLAPDLQPDTVVVSGPEVGPEVQSPDGPPSIPETCPSVTVKAAAYCQGYWPGTDPPVKCSPACVDYQKMVEGTASGIVTNPNKLLGCNSYDMTSATTGHPVVCLSGQSFCDIYCPVAK